MTRDATRLCLIAAAIALGFVACAVVGEWSRCRSELAIVDDRP